jgi:hypothetical protein
MSRLFHRRSLCLPTWRGWLLVLVVVVGVTVGLGRVVYPFLALTKPVGGDVLVIEGWLSDHALEMGAAAFLEGGYHKVYVTGGPIEKATHLSGFESYAASGAAVLLASGLSPEVVVAVPSSRPYRNRTYEAALALRDHAAIHGVELTALDVVTLGPHARRSRLCFRRAFGGDARIGVIAVSSRDYDESRWWRYSEGVKAVVTELIALPYAWVGLDYGR